MTLALAQPGTEIEADGIRILELGIDADEEALGIVELFAVRVDVLTVVIAKHASGWMASGTWIHPSEHIARAAARHSAIEHLRRALDKREKNSARCEPAPRIWNSAAEIAGATS